MKYIYLLIFFLSSFSSHNALAFWNKISNADKEYCLNKSERPGSTTFTSKKRYQQCIQEIKDQYKRARAVEKYYDYCYPALFEDFKLEAENSIKKYTGSSARELMLNIIPIYNTYFDFTEYQESVLFPEEDQWKYLGLRGDLRSLSLRFKEKLRICAEEKSKSFFKF